MRSEIQYRAANEFIFRPRGSGRFSGAVFLCLWLCGWALGEALALFFLGEGIWALLTGRPSAGADAPLRMAPALGAGAFLLVWLAIWTLGGVMAIQELFRLVWAEDRLALDRDALWRGLGTFFTFLHLACAIGFTMIVVLHAKTVTIRYAAGAPSYYCQGE